MNKPTTYYAPAEKAGEEEVQEKNRLISDEQTIKDIFSAMPEVAAVLNEERQIVYSNNTLLDLLPENEKNYVIGKRPGEVLNCVHCNENEGGCGTSESCRYCGAVNAILESQKKGQKAVKECRIRIISGSVEKSIDYEVTATPVRIRGQEFTYFFMKDISEIKRKIALERIFFHDIINTAGGIQGFTSFLHETDDPGTIKENIKIIDQLSHDLVDEIQSQRSLTLAESGDLSINPVEVNPSEILEDVKNTISYHTITEDKKIVLEKGIINHSQITDQVLLKDVQMQIFNRSFSTKGKDRGLGTYSVKLLAEKYLKGKVWFETDRINGTTFYFRIPYRIDK
ncbi:MAG: hypothetical protein K9J25_09330 [Bacteroidales bacterium]|nr:hypothetical protein [Bacteroidales bacterium]